MTEKEFKKKYLSQIPIFTEWGKYVKQDMINTLGEKLCDEDRKNTFIKIPVEPRIKGVDSIISKAFFRNKNYSNPYEQITDKVGVRFVVLLIQDIKFIKEIIENNNLWEFSKDRDFEEEREKNPLIFDYQSVHYIVRNKKELSSNGQTIPQNTPCEIQVRTLLQHAYSELTHDKIYKLKSYTSPEVIRYVARSMALIETTDSIFEEVNMKLENANSKINTFLHNLHELYSSISKSDYEPKINQFILDSYQNILDQISISDLESFLDTHSFLNDTIKKKLKISLLYRQPIILFIYYLISKQRNVCKKYWPLTESELRPLFADLGIAFERN